jgi:hypothetical protein
MVSIEVPVPAPPADASFDSAKARLTRRGIPASVVSDGRLRRLLGCEMLVVLAVFPLPATLAAVVSLSTHISLGFQVIPRPMLVPNNTTLSVVLGIALELSQMVGAGVVLYLLARSGEGPSAIGLGGGRLRLDLALVMIVWLFVQLIPQGVGTGIIGAWKLPVYQDPQPRALPLLAVGVAGAIAAGVVEEVVVLGYLVRRLEQRGSSTRTIVVIAVAVRISYHLYYGLGVLPILLWATASVLMYLKIRRLLPFIICHIAWDIAVAFGSLSHGVSATFTGSLLVISVALFIRWRNWHPQPVRGTPLYTKQ